MPLHILWTSTKTVKIYFVYLTDYRLFSGLDELLK